MDWDNALWHRDDGVAEVAARFEHAGATANDVERWLSRLSGGLVGWHVLLEEVGPRIAALLAIEMDLQGNAIREDAADMRSVAIRRLAQDESIVDIAKSLGLTRQAASRSANANSSDLATRLLRVVGDVQRSIKETL